MSDELSYLTVNDVEWAKGFQRPRMAPEERKQKHRLTQQRFVARKRQRVAELRVLEDAMLLRLKLLKGYRDEVRVALENAQLRARLDEVRQRPVLAPSDEDVELEINEMIGSCDVVSGDVGANKQCEGLTSSSDVPSPMSVASVGTPFASAQEWLCCL